MPPPKPAEEQAPNPFVCAIIIWGINGFIFSLVELTVSLAFYPNALNYFISLSWGLLVYPVLGIFLGTLFYFFLPVFERIRPTAGLNKEALQVSLSLVLYNTLFWVNWMYEIFPAQLKFINPILPYAQLGVVAAAGVGCYILYRFISAYSWRRGLLRISIACAFALDILITAGLHLNGLFIPDQLVRTPVIYNWYLISGVVFAAWAIYHLGGDSARLKRRLRLVVGFCLIIFAGGWFIFKSPVFKQIRRKSTPNSTHDYPNILFITIDALRADHLSCYGYTGIKTPAIDKLASEGVRFTKAVSQSSWTMPAMASFFSALYPRVHLGGKINFGKTRNISPMRPDIPWLPSLLQKLGYYTQAIILNSVMAKGTGFERGFDNYYNLDEEGLRQELVENKRSFLWHLLKFEDSFSDINPPTGVITQKSIAWLKKPPQPFFLWIHYLDPHQPYERYKTYNLNKTYKGKLRSDRLVRSILVQDLKLGIYKLNQADREYLESLYDEEILFVDNEIGKLLGNLHETGLLDKTLVILSSDHGEEFWDHKQYEHGHSLYREVVHIPLVMRYPKLLPRGQEIPFQVRAIDVAPTILDVLGHAGVKTQGQSLLPLIRGQETGHRAAFSEFLLYAEESKALDTGEYKLIFAPGSKRVELYDLGKDPLEQQNIIKQQPQLGRQLLKQLMDWAKACEKWTKSYSPADEGRALTPDAATRRRLKALGYIQ